MLDKKELIRYKAIALFLPTDHFENHLKYKIKIYIVCEMFHLIENYIYVFIS